MNKNKYHTELIPTDKMFLDLDNPRHGSLQQQSEAIEFLCKNEYVLPLAKDIVKNGLSPLDPVGLIRAGDTEDYIVAEGNRRFCAVKLLTDPDLAPTPTLKKQFRELSEQWDPISAISAVVFNTKEELDLWLDRTHGGLQGGIGRKTWNAEQKARHTGHKKSELAQKILDYAEDKGLIAPDDRKGKLTTAQRYLDNATFRESIGVDKSNPEEISFIKPPKDVDKMLGKFVTDLIDKNGEVNSRKNKTEIEAYARDLTQIDGVTGKYLKDPEPMDSAGKPKKKQRPTRPARVTRISYSDELHAALKDIPSYKLEKLYYSICLISLSEHTPLIAIGCWAFMETITARCGRGENTDFVSYLPPSKLESLGLGNKKKTKGVQEALKRIQSSGNVTKHDQTSAALHNEQLANDMEVLTPLMIKLAEEAKKAK